jgi:hypothetical protein
MQPKPLVIALSAVGVSLVVHRSRTRSHHARGASDSQVTDGQVVTVYGPVDADAVDTTDIQSDDQNTNGTDAEGTVESIATAAPALATSADDSEQSGSTLTVNVPASVDLSPSTQGESVEPIASPNPKGNDTPEQSSSDTGAQNDQGDTNGENPNSTEQVSAAQQLDPNLATSANGGSFVRSWATNKPQNGPVNWRPGFRPAGGAHRP